MSHTSDFEQLPEMVRALAKQLAENQLELAQLRKRIQSSPFLGSRRWAFAAGISIGLATLVGVRLVVADSAPLAGELVPRQFPYRGVLQLNGTAVTDAN